MLILLVAVHPASSTQSVPLANAFLQSYQRTTAPFPRDTVIKSAEYRLQQDLVCSAEDILSHNPSAIGFSMYVWNRHYCLELIRTLREHKPELIIFAGGPEATADAEGLLRTGVFDFLICGEGELPFAQVCRLIAENHPVGTLPGVATIDENHLFNLTPAVPLTELDQIPSPWLNGTLTPSAYPGILWQLSRGCGFTCDFCFDSRGIHGVRRFSIERIEAELRYFAATAVTQVFVLDSTFNQDSKRAKTILKLIKKIAPQVHFHFEVRSEFIDREMAELFASITCSLQIGLQSANAEVLKNVGRSFKQDDFAKRVMLLNHSGATFGFDLIYGLPGENLESFCDSLDFALNLYPNHLDIFPLAVLPGTNLAERADAIGLNYLPEPPYVVNYSSEMNKENFAAARTIANACDIFYTRGKAVAWFLCVLKAIRIKPSIFLKNFAAWLAETEGEALNEADLDDHKIWQLQRKYLSSVFSGKQLGRLLPTVLDLVDYHYHYAASVMTPIPPGAVKKIRGDEILKTCFKVADSTRMVKFNNEILDLLNAGSVDILHFSSHHSRRGSWGVIYPTADGVATESFDDTYIHLLKSVDGKTPLSDILKKQTLPAADAIEFMEFAIAEGIILSADTKSESK